MELKPTAKVAEALALAQRAAQAAGNPEITPDHLTSALVQLDTAQADALLQAAGTGAAHVLGQADARLRALPTTSGASQPPTSRAPRTVTTWCVWSPRRTSPCCVQAARSPRTGSPPP